MAAIVQEKELLLREGMRILGLQVGWGMLWWPLTQCACSSALATKSVSTIGCPCILYRLLHLPLQDGAYWASWFLTHWAGMAVSGLLCAAIGLYPFAHSRWGSGMGAVVGFHFYERRGLMQAEPRIVCCHVTCDALLLPSPHSFLLMLAFYWLVAATLLLFAYCLSTLFRRGPGVWWLVFACLSAGPGCSLHARMSAGMAPGCRACTKPE